MTTSGIRSQIWIIRLNIQLNSKSCLDTTTGTRRRCLIFKKWTRNPCDTPSLRRLLVLGSYYSSLNKCLFIRLGTCSLSGLFKYGLGNILQRRHPCYHLCVLWYIQLMQTTPASVYIEKKNEINRFYRPVGERRCIQSSTSGRYCTVSAQPAELDVGAGLGEDGNVRARDGPLQAARLVL